MAHGDEYTLSGGPLSGATYRSIDVVAGTGTFDLVPAVAAQRIRLLKAVLTIEGVAQVDLVEETSGASRSGPYHVPAGALGGTVTVEPGDGVVTGAVNKAIQVTRSASVGVSGWVAYSQATSP